MSYANMRLRRDISGYLDHMKDRNLNHIYITQSKCTLRRFEALCVSRGIRATSKIDSDTVRTYLDGYLHHAAATQAKQWAYLKSFLAWAEHPLALKFRFQLTGIGRRVEWLTPEEIEQILTTKMTLLEAVLVCGAFLEGARPIEILRLSVRDAKDALATGQIRWFGKGRERRVKLLREYAEVLRAYLESSVDRPDCAPLLDIGYWMVWRMVRGVSERSGVDFSLYDGRRGFARSLMLRGVAIEKISPLMGHKDINTTKGYLGVGEEDLDQAMDQLEVPPLRITRSQPAE